MIKKLKNYIDNRACITHAHDVLRRRKYGALLGLFDAEGNPWIVEKTPAGYAWSIPYATAPAQIYPFERCRTIVHDGEEITIHPRGEIVWEGVSPSRGVMTFEKIGWRKFRLTGSEK